MRARTVSYTHVVGRLFFLLLFFFFSFAAQTAVSKRGKWACAVTPTLKGGRETVLMFGGKIICFQKQLCQRANNGKLDSVDL